MIIRWLLKSHSRLPTFSKLQDEHNASSYFCMSWTEWLQSECKDKEFLVKTSAIGRKSTRQNRFMTGRAYASHVKTLYLKSLDRAIASNLPEAGQPPPNKNKQDEVAIKNHNLVLLSSSGKRPDAVRVNPRCHPHSSFQKHVPSRHFGINGYSPRANRL